MNHAVSGVGSSNELLIVCVSHCKLRVVHGVVALGKFTVTRNGERNALAAMRIVVTGRRGFLLQNIHAFIKAKDLYHSVRIRLENCAIISFAARSCAVLLDELSSTDLLQSKFDVCESRLRLFGANLFYINAVGVIVGRVDNRCANAVAVVRVVRVGQSDGVLLAFTEHAGVNLSMINLCLIVHIDL